MHYYRITTTTPYCGTDNEHYIASQEPMSQEALRDTAEELTRENAENFEYLVTGWEDENIEDLNEDEIQELLDNYYADCSYVCEEISKSEYNEAMGVE